jgi:hypothetical protein
MLIRIRNPHSLHTILMGIPDGGSIHRYQSTSIIFQKITKRLKM